MDLITSSTLGEYVSSPRRSQVLTVSDLVEQALLLERKSLYGHEQREADRYPFTRLVELTPYDPIQKEKLGDTITAGCRNLSQQGLGFYHSDPLATRYALVQLHPGAGAADSPKVLMKLVWCRFLKPNWYDNGGRFVRIVTTTS